MWTLFRAAAHAGGSLHGPDCHFSGVGTDSRADCRGQLFVALRGACFDGHDYVVSAREAGAVAAMVDHPLPVDLPQWVVEDTRLGLGRLAAAWRDRFPGRVIAITGSNGKTTVKEMMAAILARVGRVRATQGNLNNDIGMPLTLLGAREEDFLVLELGANHPGEIGYMTDIARPDLALITNAGRAHLEGFGSVEGVARAKGEIVRGLSDRGVLVVGGDSPYLPLWRTLAGGRRVLTFALSGAADLLAERAAIRVSWNQEGFRTDFEVVAGGPETRTRAQSAVAAENQSSGALPAAAADLLSDSGMRLGLQLAGEHNVRNALAAVAAALALGLDADAIRDGLAALRPVKGRLCPRRCRGLGIIDDSYNANPDSLAAAIQVLAALSGRRWLVLGDLGELGAETPRLHAEIGASARDAGVDRLLSVGTWSAAASQAFGEGARHFDDQGALLDYLQVELRADDRVLVKGSRLARMELVVEALCAEAEM